ncbi:hypothetical protein [Chryseosolibacter indicus]|uniref:Por secretion system C-terminal sorting domain-containing protein n=1 Tax=Chryseosolibacter indicus TaxID=2782351 RepID=A0ABS5VVQ4_9BACT|nr:hypothetical protein [Chryseosolibacter indicus]MBT1704954.1 hypothetical protein [Chryseosolibacter indicus]
MNKFLATLLVITIATVSVNAKIDEPKSGTGVAVMKSGSTFKLFYKAERTNNVRVTIYDANRKAVFAETLRQVSNFMRPYNFSSLTEGDYTIEVVDDNGKSIENVEYYNGKINRYANVVRLAGSMDKYILSIANKGNNEITVKIFAEGNNLIYKGVENINGDFAKIYKLGNANGNIVFEVSDQNGILKSFTY